MADAGIISRDGAGGTSLLLAGTSANNLLQLDGSGNMPAVNGAALTGIVAAASALTGATLAAGVTASSLVSFGAAPALGAATATSINKVAFTQPASAATLTILNNKTFTVNHSLTLAGTDSTTMTFPTTTATIARTDTGQTFTGTQTFGALVYTTLNGNTWATGTGTLSIAAAKTLTASNSIIISGTDGSTLNVGTGGTLGTNAYTSTAYAPLASPTLVTPVLGVATGTSIALGGATLGANALAITGTVNISGNTTLGSAAQLLWSTDLIVTRRGAANINFGAADVDTGPVAQSLSVQSALTGGTNNVAGANFTIKGSQGKGTGIGGSLIFQTAPAGGSGNSPNALATALTIDSTKLATFAGGASVATMAMIAAFNYAADAGANDTYVITLAPAAAAYTTGMAVYFKANTANTGAASININGLGAKTIVKAVNTTLANNDILASMICHIVYDGTNFVLMNPRVL